MPPADPSDIAIALPASWRRTSDPGCGVLVAATATTLPPGGVRPSVRLRCEPVSDGVTGWAAESLATLRTTRVDFALEDEDDVELAGCRAGYRRYAHRVRGSDVLCDEWTWLREGVGFVLTCSVAREDYPDYCDVFEAIAQTVEPSL